MVILESQVGVEFRVIPGYPGLRAVLGYQGGAEVRVIRGLLGLQDCKEVLVFLASGVIVDIQALLEELEHRAIAECRDYREPRVNLECQDGVV